MTLISIVNYNKYTCQKKKKPYISVGTVRMFTEALTIARFTHSLFAKKIAKYYN